MKIINKTTNGTIFRCNQCNNIHIEYNNLSFSFSPSQFNFFVDFFKNIKANHWEKMNAASPYSRKIIIPVHHRNITLLMNAQEVKEMRVLLGIEKIDLERCPFPKIALETCIN
ncbi:DUF6686 family protein [Thermophagus sp. OGC60D27]|uniref:DUF6686 family protein n=1 Tax=Thermophagus sp. OGC60D27 TaxID=3458415 RepID=UPI0040383EED